MTPPIAIVGAGEAGLTLARLLEVNNIDYVVFEQNASTDSRGFWGCLDMYSHTAQVVLKEAGLFDKFEAVAKFDTQVSGMFDQHGEIISRSDLDDLPQIDWHDLRALLIESVPGEKIRWNSEVQSLEKDSQGLISIQLADGTVEKGFKLIVGADGMWSKVRESITSAEPRYFGITYLRTSISHESEFWSTVAGKLAITNYMAIGQGKQIAARKLVAGTYMVLVGLPLPEEWSDSEMSDPSAFRNKLLHNEFEHWGPRVINWIRHSDGHFKAVPLYTMPVESLSWDPVAGYVLVGDAAHPSTPWGGESMGCGMFDSYELVQQILKYGLDGLDQAIAEYESLMFPRAIDLVEKSSEIGSVFFAKDAANMMQALLSGS